jgi:hypothetical protein
VCKGSLNRFDADRVDVPDYHTGRPLNRSPTAPAIEVYC